MVLDARHDPSLILVFFTSLVGIDCRKINGKKIPLGNFCQFNFFYERSKWLLCDTVIYDIFASTALFSDRYHFYFHKIIVEYREKTRLRAVADS